MLFSLVYKLAIFHCKFSLFKAIAIHCAGDKVSACLST